MFIGSHVKMAAKEYVLGSVKEAISYDANALMLYTGAPQNTARKPISDMRVDEAKALAQEYGISLEHMVIHAPYLINPANSVKPEVAELAVTFLQDEILRTQAIGARNIVVHPGSYTKTDLQTGIQTIIKQLNKLEQLPDDVTICLETMAGKGSEVGYRFEQLAEIIEGLDHPEHFGVCFDTCHTHDAGYDLSNFDNVMQEFDHYIGLDRLRVIHLNDSKNERGARKDRHANIGQGHVGLENLIRIAHDPRFENIPIILETPYIDGQPPYKEEIALIRKG